MNYYKITEMMLVSVIICTHKMERFNDFVEAVDSLISQTYDDLEIITVVDGNKELYNKIIKEVKVDKIILNKNNLGLSESRNRGIKVASGEIVAFLDDDAIADKNWIKELVKIYEERDAIAVGGKIVPKWISKKPRFLPEEFYWLIGATHKGFPEDITEVRNTFGSNLSFKANVLKTLGGFRNDIGVRGDKLFQGEETEICERLRRKFGRGVIYNPNAVVYHKVYPERLKMGYLLRRCFWQGYSKALLERYVGRIEEEKSFLKYLVTNSSFDRLKKIFSGSVEDLGKLINTWLFTFSVGVGYVYGKLK